MIGDTRKRESLCVSIDRRGEGERLRNNLTL